MKVKVYATGKIKWEGEVEAESEEQAAADVGKQMKHDYPGVRHWNVFAEEVE